MISHKPLLYSIFLTIGAFYMTVTSCQYSSGQSNWKDSTLTAEDSLKRYNDSVERHRERVLHDPKTQEYIAQIADYYKYILGRRFNGAVLIAYKGVPIFEKYQGYSDFSKRTPITKHTTFQLSSTSKPFTSMAILKLIIEGELDFSDSVQTFFPDFPYEGVTIRHLLTHRSGLPKYLYFTSKYLKDNKPMTNDEVIDLMIKNKPHRYARPDTRFQYNNTNYVILAAIIQHITGMTLDDYFNETFFTPLGMNDTYVYRTGISPPTENQSLTYDFRTHIFPENRFDGVVGDKNVYSTVEDLLKWDQGLYPGHLFDEEDLDIAYTPFSPEEKGVGNYGLGWRLKTYSDSNKVIYHNGWWHGNTSTFCRYIQDSTTIIILSNRFNKKIYDVDHLEKIMGIGEYAKKD